MYINRLSIKIHQDKHIVTDEIKTFNGAANHFEEVMFHFLPKKVNLGGYGFLTIKLHEASKNKSEIKAYGQIMDIEYMNTDFNLNSFCKLSAEEKFHTLLNIFEESISEVALQYEIDKDIFLKAINDCRSNGVKTEQVLKISRTHKSRKFKVNIIRIVEPNNESIICRIIGKDGKLKDEIILDSDSSIYSASHDFKKSLWDGNFFRILDRFDGEHKSIDVSKYIS